jgi:hypothetical protein
VLGEGRGTKENEGVLNVSKKRNEKDVKFVEGYLKGNVQNKTRKGWSSLLNWLT